MGGPEAPAEALVPGGDRVHAVSHPRTRLTGGSDCAGPDRFPGASALEAAPLATQGQGGEGKLGCPAP